MYLAPFIAMLTTARHIDINKNKKKSKQKTQLENQAIKMSENRRKKSLKVHNYRKYPLKIKYNPQTSHCWKKGTIARWNNQKSTASSSWQRSAAGLKTEQTNKVTQEPQEAAQSAAPELEVKVYKNYVPLCAVLIGIVGIGIYMRRIHSVGEQSDRNPN